MQAPKLRIACEPFAHAASGRRRDDSRLRRTAPRREKPPTSSSTRWCRASSPATRGSCPCGRRSRRCGSWRKRTAACSARCSRGVARSGVRRAGGIAARPAHVLRERHRDAAEGARRAPRAPVRLGSPVSSLTHAAGTAAPWTIALGSGESLTADHVVIAVPPPAAAALLAPLDATLAGTLATIPLAPLVVVALGFDAAALGHPLDGFGFLVPRGQGVRILGALWESSVYPGRAASGRALIRVMTGGAHDPSVAEPRLTTRLLGLVRRRPPDDDGDQRPSRRWCASSVTAMRSRSTPSVISTVWRASTRRSMRLPGLHLTGHGYRGVGINARDCRCRLACRPPRFLRPESIPVRCIIRGRALSSLSLRRSP